jgi:polysaccharide deacetylase family protein (PEP-CTERM system associated)
MNNARSDKTRPLALLSFDVEEHCQIEAARGAVGPEDWPQWSGRIERNVDWLLETLAQLDARATFFVLGYVARHRPWIVRDIAAAGHEIACHGYAHDRLHRLTPEALATDLAAAQAAIEDQAQQQVRGYRAPSFSLHGQTRWAVDVIAERGFAYDSSVQPIYHPSYGQPDAPRRPYRLVGATGAALAELPPLTWQVRNHRLPVAGGGYFRLLPLWFMTRGIAQADRAGYPAILYFHPWEFDADQPRLPLSRRQRFRTYVGIKSARKRLVRLISQVDATTYGDWLDSQSSTDWPCHALPETAIETTTDSQPSAFDALVMQGDPYLDAFGNQVPQPLRRAG